MNVELKEEIEWEDNLMVINQSEIFVINHKGWIEEMVYMVINETKISIEEMIFKDKEKDLE